jgi:hypothetical protein
MSQVNFSQTIEPGDLLNPTMRQRAETEFGTDGSWLLLSIVYYSWRAFFDLAHAMWTGNSPVAQTNASPRAFDEEFQIARHLQVQSFVYAAVEQFATLVYAARTHRSGSDAFFQSYVSAPTLGEMIRSLATLDRAELEGLTGGSSEIQAVVARLRSERGRTSPGTPVDLDPAKMKTTNLGGLHIPESVVENGAFDSMVRHSEDLLDLLLVNIDEMQALVVAPPVDDDEAPRPQSLREVDNSFRHGLRVLLHTTIPSARGFKLIGDEPSNTGYAATVFLPKGGDRRVSYGGVECDPGSTFEMLDVLRETCTRTGQFARAFLGFQSMANADLLIASSTLRLEFQREPQGGQTPGASLSDGALLA